MPDAASTQRRDRAAELISGFASAAAAAQAARSVPEIFRVAREQLALLDLSVAIAEVRGEGLEVLGASGLFSRLGDEFLRRGKLLPIGTPGIQQAILHHPNGVLIENVRQLVAQAWQRPLAEIDLPSELIAVGAAIHVGGAAAFTITAAGVDLDRSIAPAFGLFARQLGAAIETSRRLEELARSNRELTIINHVARTGATLGSGRSLESALGWLKGALSIDGIALLRAEGPELVLAVHEGMPEVWVARSARVPLADASP